MVMTLKLNWNGQEIPAYIDISKYELNNLSMQVFGKPIKFPKCSCITEDVEPKYRPKPKNILEVMQELCLRGLIKRGTYIVELNNGL